MTEGAAVIDNEDRVTYTRNDSQISDELLISQNTSITTDSEYLTITINEVNFYSNHTLANFSTKAVFVIGKVTIDKNIHSSICYCSIKDDILMEEKSKTVCTLDILLLAIFRTSPATSNVNSSSVYATSVPV